MPRSITAGGFGKTTVAKLVRADRRVLRRFGGRVYWITLGRDARPRGDHGDTPAQARALVTAGLPPLSEQTSA